MKNIPIWTIFAIALILVLNVCHGYQKTTDEERKETVEDIKDFATVLPDHPPETDETHAIDKLTEWEQFQDYDSAASLLKYMPEIAKYIANDSATHAELSIQKSESISDINATSADDFTRTIKRQAVPFIPDIHGFGNGLGTIGLETLEELEEHSCEMEASGYGHDREAGTISHEVLCEVGKLWQYIILTRRNLHYYLSLHANGTLEQQQAASALSDCLSKGITSELLTENSLLANPEVLLFLVETVRSSVPTSSIQETLERIRSATYKLVIHLRQVIMLSLYRENSAFSEHAEVVEQVQEKVSCLETALTALLQNNSGFGKIAIDEASKVSILETALHRVSGMKQTLSQYVILMQELLETAKAMYRGYQASSVPRLVAAHGPIASSLSSRVGSTIFEWVTKHESMSTFINGYLFSGLFGPLKQFLQPTLPTVTPSSQPHFGNTPNRPDTVSSISSTTPLHGHRPNSPTPGRTTSLINSYSHVSQPVSLTSTVTEVSPFATKDFTQFPQTQQSTSSSYVTPQYTPSSQGIYTPTTAATNVPESSTVYSTTTGPSSSDYTYSLSPSSSSSSSSQYTSLPANSPALNPEETYIQKTSSNYGTASSSSSSAALVEASENSYSPVVSASQTDSADYVSGSSSSATVLNESETVNTYQDSVSETELISRLSSPGGYLETYASPSHSPIQASINPKTSHTPSGSSSTPLINPPVIQNGTSVPVRPTSSLSAYTEVTTTPKSYPGTYSINNILEPGPYIPEETTIGTSSSSQPGQSDSYSSWSVTSNLPTVSQAIRGRPKAPTVHTSPTHPSRYSNRHNTGGSHVLSSLHSSQPHQTQSHSHSPSLLSSSNIADLSSHISSHLSGTSPLRTVIRTPSAPVHPTTTSSPVQYTNAYYTGAPHILPPLQPYQDENDLESSLNDTPQPLPSPPRSGNRFTPHNRLPSRTGVLEHFVSSSSLVDKSQILSLHENNSPNRISSSSNIPHINNPLKHTQEILSSSMPNVLSASRIQSIKSAITPSHTSPTLPINILNTTSTVHSNHQQILPDVLCAEPADTQTTVNPRRNHSHRKNGNNQSSKDHSTGSRPDSSRRTKTDNRKHSANHDTPAAYVPPFSHTSPASVHDSSLASSLSSAKASLHRPVSVTPSYPISFLPSMSGMVQNVIQPSQETLQTSLSSIKEASIGTVSLVFPQEKVSSALGKKSLSPGDVVAISVRNGTILIGYVIDSNSPIIFNNIDSGANLSNLRRTGRLWNLRAKDFQDVECRRQLQMLL